jgi:cell division septation protein DedD
MQGDEDKRSRDAGTELILDNRKLILAFGALVVVCGAFFVLGFIEGKRQGVQLGMNMSAAGNPPEQALNISQTEGSESDPDRNGKVDDQAPTRDQLNWYRSVSKSPDSAQGSSTTNRPREETGSTRDASKAAPKSEESSAALETTAAGTASYTVQVGAFRQRKEAEIKADELRRKGYQFILEDPAAPGELYLLKVGKFDSRADAAVMQLRLKKDGFATFIKTN